MTSSVLSRAAADRAGRRAVSFLLLLGLVATASSTARAGEEEAVRTYHLRLSLDYMGATNERDALAAFQAYCDEVAKVVTQRFRPTRAVVKFAPSIEHLIREFEDGEVDSAYLSAYEYVRIRERVDIIPLTTAIRSTGRPEHRGLLVVRADDPATSILDMRGKRFVYLNQSSTYGYLFPQWLLCMAGEPDLPRFFGKTTRVTKEKSALYAVLLREADVASISDYTLETMFELKPSLRKRLRVLARSEPLPLGVFAVAPSVDPEVREILRSAICDDDELVTELRESLRYIKVAAMRRTDDAHFDPVRSLIRLIEANEQRYVCPVCARRLSEQAVGATLGEGALCVRLCGESCRATYREQGERAKPGAERPLVVAGLDPSLLLGRDPRDARAMCEYLLQQTLEKHGKECAIQFITGHELVRARLKDRTLSVVHLSGPGYVRLAAETAIVPLVRHERHTSAFRACLVVSPRVEAKRLEDLRGTSLATYATGDSALNVFLRTLLRPLGATDATGFFGSVITCPSEEAAIRAVAFGEVDSALVQSESVDLLRELKPGLYRDLRILCRSEEVVSGPLCCRADLEDSLGDLIREFTVGLLDTPKGRAILSTYGSRRMVDAKDSDYDSIRLMMRNSDD